MSILSSIRRRPRIFDWLHRLRLVEAHSQTHPDERACLCRYASGAGVMVEIGTFMGVTAAELSLALPEGGMLYCVDPYPGGGEPLQQIALRQIARAGAASKVRLMRTDSAGAVVGLPAQVDFFFVDGDHSYEGLAADWKVVKQLLRPGGIAAFHDVLPVAGVKALSCGAVKFYRDVISADPDFNFIQGVRSLAILKRTQV